MRYLRRAKAIGIGFLLAIAMDMMLHRTLLVKLEHFWIWLALGTVEGLAWIRLVDRANSPRGL